MALWHLSTGSTQQTGSHHPSFPLSRIILTLLAHRLVASLLGLLQPQADRPRLDCFPHRCPTQVAWNAVHRPHLPEVTQETMEKLLQFLLDPVCHLHHSRKLNEDAPDPDPSRPVHFILLIGPLQEG